VGEFTTNKRALSLGRLDFEQSALEGVDNHTQLMRSPIPALSHLDLDKEGSGCEFSDFIGVKGEARTLS